MEQTPIPAVDIGDIDPMNAHLSADDLSGMVDGRLPTARRGIVEAHLAVCGECRAELLSASAIVQSAPPVPVRRSRWIARGALAAAAGLVILIVPRVSRRATQGTTDGLTRRGSTPNSVATIDPAPRVSVDRDSIRFTWHGERDASYRIVVLDSAGLQVYTTPTTDTVVIPPASLQLSPGAQYFWYVDALRPDGSSVPTAPSSFSIRAR